MLNKNTLKTGLIKIMDSKSSEFLGFTGVTSEVADKWADVINEYAKNVTPVSSSYVAAKTAFYSVMLGISINNGKQVLISAFSAYARILAAGMSPSFVGTPPLVLIDFSLLYSLPISTNISVKVSTMADIIDAWFKTGTAVPSSGGNFINWF